MKYYYTIMQSPVGGITLIADDKSLCAIYWPNQKPEHKKFPDLQKDDNNKILKSAQKQLIDYFKGKRTDFDLPLRPLGTIFQEQVWGALTSIGYGETVTYSDIANEIKNPKALRAVGAAIGRNPISIIIPCHRVIGSNGKLTGFAGGLSTKEFLLNLENKAQGD